MQLIVYHGIKCAMVQYSVRRCLRTCVYRDGYLHLKKHRHQHFAPWSRMIGALQRVNAVRTAKHEIPKMSWKKYENPCNWRQKRYNSSYIGIGARPARFPKRGGIRASSSITDSTCAHLFLRTKATAYMVGERCGFAVTHASPPPPFRECGVTTKKT